MTDDRRNQDRRSADPRVTELVEKMRLVEQRADDIAKQLKFNTDITERVVKNTADIIVVWEACRGGLQVLGWMGTAVRWLLMIGGCVATVYAALYALTHVGPPPPP